MRNHKITVRFDHAPSEPLSRAVKERVRRAIGRCAAVLFPAQRDGSTLAVVRGITAEEADMVRREFE